MKVEKIRPTSLTPSLAVVEAVAGRGDFVEVALPTDRFSNFSLIGDGDLSTPDTESRIEVTVLVEGLTVVVAEYPSNFGLVVAARLVGFAGALKLCNDIIKYELFFKKKLIPCDWSRCCQRFALG